MSHQYKIITIVGARPHFIKVASLINALDPDRWQHLLVHSGQHYDVNLSDRFFKEFRLPPVSYNLEIGSQSTNRQIADCILKFDQVLEKERPDVVLVIGDTNTTAAAAIATKKRHITLGHIEAGLREFDRSIPEEINKLLIDAVSDLYFVPTLTGMKNLAAEGKKTNVYLTGDIALDLLTNVWAYPDITTLRSQFDLKGDYALMTCHRQVNTEHLEHLVQIIDAAAALPCPVIFPVHPRTRKALEKVDLSNRQENIQWVDPLGFWETQQLIRHARMVLTDSGGIIKEAYFHKVPSIIIDRQTEWLEVVDEGWSVITGPDKAKILEAFHTFKIPQQHRMSLGDGKAGKMIVQILETYLDAKRS
ncbi:MAG: UDP-N-acetylglucosamine 2-epimerase (non-hydrolyzing) [Saprospiraceae bacterium]|nr:UDP-N-acetylglucosamine 2-epimerase (non-hydrolyzing) [Saprospiraceae bacterium]